MIHKCCTRVAEDGTVDEGEFEKFWMSKVKNDKAMADVLFNSFDSNDDGAFGDDQFERRAFFDVFDYNGNCCCM